VSELASLIVRLAVEGSAFVHGMGQAEESSESFADSFRRTATEIRNKVDLAQQTIRQFGEAAREVFEFTEEGAEIRQLSESFDRTKVDLDALRDSARGTVDDVTLMSQSMTLLAGTSGDLEGALTAALPDLLEIAKASNKVNPELGQTSFLFESLATGVKRGSAMMIDNAGITFSVSQAYAEFADRLGKSADALSDEEKKIALLQKTISEGQTLIEQAGGDVESYTDSWSQMRVEIKNMTDELKANSATVAGPVFNAYTKFLRVSQSLNAEMIGLSAAGRMWASVLGAGEDGVRRVGFVIDVLTGNYLGAQLALESYADSLEEVRHIEERVGLVTDKSVEKGARVAEAYANEMLSLQGMANSLESVNRLTSHLQTEEAKVYDSVVTTVEAINWQIQAVQDAQTAADNLRFDRLREEAALTRQSFLDTAAALGEMSKAQLAQTLIQSLQDAGLEAEEMAAAHEAILKQFGLLTESEVFVQSAIDDLTKALAEGKIEPADYAREVERLHDGLVSLPDYKKLVLELEERRTIAHEAAGVLDWMSLYQGMVPDFGGPQATGGDYVINTPTMFLAGEAGPERATFTPLSDMGDGGARASGSTWYGNINISGASDPDATARAVMQQLQDRGMIPSTRFR